MKYSITIEFKSAPEMYIKESQGIKNNTVRFVNDMEDTKILALLDDITHIRIVNTDDRISTDSFVRSITDISRFKHKQSIVYIFTWER